MQDLNVNTELTLKFENQTAVVSPYGASLRSFCIEKNAKTWFPLWSYRGKEKKGGQGDVLAPFPGRIKEGRYTFSGKTHELEKNDKDGPNAIHGFLRNELWTIKDSGPTHAHFSFQMDAITYSPKGYPFSLLIEVKYSIGAEGLKTWFQITNTGEVPAPAGIGFHPYFCGDSGELSDWEAFIPAESYLELDNLIPTGRHTPVAESSMDFRNGRLIGSEKYNDCLTDLRRNADNEIIIKFRNPQSSAEIKISIDTSFNYVVIYTGDQIPTPDNRRAFAIEPMTCAPNAFNLANEGLEILEPLCSMSGSYTFSARL